MDEEDRRQRSRFAYIVGVAAVLLLLVLALVALAGCADHPRCAGSFVVLGPMELQVKCDPAGQR